MSVKSGQAVTVDFTTANPTTGAAANASSLPTATLVVNGTDNAATVTVTNKTTGVYKAAVTLPTLSAGDVVSIRVAATVATVAGVGVVWTDVTDTKRVSDLKDEAMRGTDGAATPEDVQVTVPEPVFAGTVTFSGTVEAPAVTVNPTLTPEESAKLMGAAQEATLVEVADAVAALPTAPVGTRIDQTSEDASGEVLGLATPGSSITAYLASDTERTDPKRHTTATSDGTWALYLSAGAYVLVVALDGYYDATDGDSVIERTVVVP